MQTLTEIEERVSKALESFNYQKVITDEVEVLLKLDRYDFKAETHLNYEAFDELHKAMAHLADYFSPENEEIVRKHIKTYRDLSEVAYIDFNIRIVEPNIFEFERLGRLFGEQHKLDRLVAPCYSEQQHLADLSQKVFAMLNTAYDACNVPSTKLLKQFERMVQWQIHGKIPDVRESYSNFASKILHNPAKKMESLPAATINYDVAPEAPKAEAAGIETFDNAEFEARFAGKARPERIKELRKVVPTVEVKNVPADTLMAAPDTPIGYWGPDGPVITKPEQIIVATNVSSDFADFCEQIYHSRFTNS